MKILFLGNKQRSEDIVKKFGETQLIEYDCFNEMAVYLKNLNEHGEIHDIIVIMPDISKNDGQALYQMICSEVKNKNITNPVFIWSTTISHEELSNLNFYANNLLNKYLPQNSNNLDKLLFHALESTLDEVKTESVKQFNRVSIERILEHNYVDCDLFLKLSDIKFVKIINAKEFFSTELINGLQKKGVEYIYVKLEDYMKFIDFIHNSLRSKFKMNVQDPINSFCEDQEMVAFVQETVYNLKIDADIIKTLNEVAISILNNIKKYQSLRVFLELAHSNKNGYLYKHSLLTGHIGNLIAMRMKWNSQHTLQKLALAAILHDVVLSSEKLARVEDLNNIDYQKFSIAEVNLIKKHPSQGRELVETMKDLPLDVANIVFTHHERPDGSGYPRGLASQHISQISALFIIAEDFVNKILGEEKIHNENFISLAPYFKKKYEYGNFRYPCEGLLKILNESI